MFRVNLQPRPDDDYNRSMAIRQESDLYAPLKRFFEQQGYEVRGEVKDCDLVARRDERLVVVEMKISFNLTLVLQGLRRQQVSEHVYVAIETPRRQPRTRRWREIKHLCQRLSLGLLIVNFQVEPPLVEVVLEAGVEQAPRPRRVKQAQVTNEFDGRSGDFNTGGSTRRPLVTAYRLAALRIVGYLQTHGPSPLGNIKAALGQINAGGILRRDHYGWFERAARGVYGLSAAGEAAGRQYADVLDGSANIARKV